MIFLDTPFFQLWSLDNKFVIFAEESDIEQGNIVMNELKKR